MKNAIIIALLVVVVGYLVIKFVDKDILDISNNSSQSEQETLVKTDVASSLASDKTYKIDEKESVLTLVEMGVVGGISAKIPMKNGQLVASEGKTTTTDIKLDVANLMTNSPQNLESAAGLSTQIYPEGSLTVKSLSFDQTSSAAQSAAYVLTADITLKGVTNEVKFKSTLDNSGEKMIISGRSNVDWSVWGADFEKNFALDITIVANR